MFRGLQFAFGFAAGSLLCMSMIFMFMGFQTPYPTRDASGNATPLPFTPLRLTPSPPPSCTTKPNNSLRAEGSAESPLSAEYIGLIKPGHPKFYSNDPPVCVIIRTYKGHINQLPALIVSLASNEYPNLHIHITDTQGDFEELPKIETLFDLVYNKDFVHISNVTTAYAKQRYPNAEFPYSDFGYTQTDLVIEQLSAPDHPHQCEYFMVTNGDNIYGRDVMKFTVSFMRAEYTAIGFHFVSHYCYEEIEPFRPRRGCYSCMYSEFKLQRIDLGAALFSKRKMMEKNQSFIMGELARNPTGKQIEVHFLDGYFFERMTKDDPRVIVINATLFMHQ